MKINLNNQNEFTLENIKKLIASEDDTVSTQFRVTTEGYLYLSKTVGNNDLEGVLFRLETNVAQNDYIGEAAANDEKWVKRIYNVIKENYPNPSFSYIDNF